MNDSPSKKFFSLLFLIKPFYFHPRFGQNSQNRSKSKKDDAELGLKDATNKLNTSGSFNKTDNKELSNTQKSGVFKSLLGGFKKHKPDNISPSKLKETNMEVELKLMESGYTIRKKDKSSNKSKFINRRNITDGKIQIMRLDNNDVVDENYDIPTKENIYELLDQIPAKVSSHLESFLYIKHV